MVFGREPFLSDGVDMVAECVGDPTFTKAPPLPQQQDPGAHLFDGQHDKRGIKAPLWV